MILPITTAEQKKRYLSVIHQVATEEPLSAIKYLDFGTKIVRVLCYSSKILLFLNQQLPFVLKDDAPHYDETIVFWQVKDIQQLAYRLDDQLNPKMNLRMRVEMLALKRKYPDIMVMDKEFSKVLPVIRLSVEAGVIEAYDAGTCYYGVANLEPEELIKQGHLFVQQLNVLLKTDNVNLTHGAVLGYAWRGVLLCARGQRGKSTLTVHSLLNGCDYVSDDYQLLEKQGENLYAYPLYSIITLSPQMYAQMYDDFKGKFCSNNGRKDKYVFNIAPYHAQFKVKYPIKFCLFPEIMDVERPDISPCSAADKGRAIVQFIHSTVLQMRDLNDPETISKLFHMIKDLPFYKFYLCPNISENTRYLYQFLRQEHPPVPGVDLPSLLWDITFDVATLLDTKTYTLYVMNKFATNVYEMLISGVAPQEIVEKLSLGISYRPALRDEWEIFMDVLERLGLLSVQAETSLMPVELSVDFMRECKYKLSLQVFEPNQTQELIQNERKIK